MLLSLKQNIKIGVFINSHLYYSKLLQDTDNYFYNEVS